MATFNIKKGLDIPIKGMPSNSIESKIDSHMIKLHPSEIYGIKPKLNCTIGDNVKIGSELFYDKVDPSVKFVSNCSGVIKNIVLGERRVIKEIVIENDNENSHLDRYNSFTASSIGSADTNKLLDDIKNSGYWSYIRTRPFSKIANSDKSPKSFFVSCFNTAPHAVNTNLLINDNKEAIQIAINALCKVSSLNYINFSINSNVNEDFFKTLYNINLHTFNGPHPAGNVGIHIHHIDPINVGETVWYMDFQDLISLGKFLTDGKIHNTRLITLSGEQLEMPLHCNVLKGAHIKSILQQDLDNVEARIINGDVLTGKTASINDGLGYYSSQIAVLPESKKREFIGWLMPGIDKYTFSNTYLSKFIKNKEWSLNTLMNGSFRSIIPFGYWEDVLPMDILPQYLVKSILAKDIEEMENLGIYECDEEDFALCTFVCQSKVPVQHIIKDGLRLMEIEG